MGGGVGSVFFVLDVRNRTHLLHQRIADYKAAAFIGILAFRLRLDRGKIVAPNTDRFH
jgi:hypothetical protein